jgi:hypothetical protein
MLKLKHFNAQTYETFTQKKNLGTIDFSNLSVDYEKEAFKEYTVHVFANAIKSFISIKTNVDKNKKFINRVFGEILDIGADDPVWKLLEYIEQETDFYTAPASTKYHGSEECGLVRHSLLVAANGIKLAPAMLEGEVDMYYLVVSCLFHDLCKVNMYEQYQRNLKNETTGKWETKGAYRIRDDYQSYGHGIESMLRLNKFIEMPESWNQAIRWHMGAYDISPMDKPALEKALARHRDVLFLQTADMMAGLVEEI